MRHREPMNPIHGECHAGHVQRCGVSEDVKPRQPHHEIYACEELAKTRHPETPHAHRTIDFGAGFGITEKNLPTPDEVARAETEKTDRNGPKWRTRECKGLLRHCFRPHPLTEPCNLYPGPTMLGRVARSFLVLRTVRGTCA